MAVTRLPVVGILGSGSVAHQERAATLGRWLAGQGVHLLTGGGGGVMSAVSGTEPMSRNHINVLSSNVLVALPGGAGTASEVSLALRYGRPLIAYLRARDEIPDLPASVRAESALERVKAFVRERIA